MRKILSSIAFVMAFCLLSVGCDSETEYGQCVGIQDVRQAEQDNPGVLYRVSGWNVAMGVIFLETIFAPIIWLAADFKCPVARKNVTAK